MMDTYAIIDINLMWMTLFVEDLIIHSRIFIPYVASLVWGSYDM